MTQPVHLLPLTTARLQLLESTGNAATTEGAQLPPGHSQVQKKAQDGESFSLYPQGGMTLARPPSGPSPSHAFQGADRVFLDVVQGQHPEGPSEGFGGSEPLSWVWLDVFFSI